MGLLAPQGQREREGLKDKQEHQDVMDRKERKAAEEPQDLQETPFLSPSKEREE